MTRGTGGEIPESRHGWGRVAVDMSSDERYLELKARLATIHDLSKVSALLSWDQSVMMPPGGAAARAEQMATMGRMAHELFTAPEVGRLLDELRPFEASLPYDSDEASLIRVTRADYEKAVNVPASLSLRIVASHWSPSSSRFSRGAL